MAELKLVNRRDVPVEVRIIPLDDESYLSDVNGEFIPLDNVEFEHGIILKGRPLSPVVNFTSAPD